MDVYLAKIAPTRHGEVANLDGELLDTFYTRVRNRHRYCNGCHEQIGLRGWPLGHQARGDEMFPVREPPFDLRELSGRGVDDARRRCELDGFSVEVIDLDKNSYVALDLRPNRIRLKTRKGRVIEAQQG